jgi:hypothetical protein
VATRTSVAVHIQGVEESEGFIAVPVTERPLPLGERTRSCLPSLILISGRLKPLASIAHVSIGWAPKRLMMKFKGRLYAERRSSTERSRACRKADTRRPDDKGIVVSHCANCGHPLGLKRPVWW